MLYTGELFPHPIQSKLSWIPSSLIFLRFHKVLDSCWENPGTCVLTDLGSVGIQHLHVLQLLQTLSVVEDGCLVIASDKCLVPFFLEGYENKSYRWALYTLQNAFRFIPLISNCTLKCTAYIHPTGTCHLCLSADSSGLASLRISFSKFTPNLLSSFSEKVNVPASWLRTIPSLPQRPSLHTWCYKKGRTMNFLVNMLSFRLRLMCHWVV